MSTLFAARYASHFRLVEKSACTWDRVGQTRWAHHMVARQNLQQWPSRCAIPSQRNARSAHSVRTRFEIGAHKGQACRSCYIYSAGGAHHDFQRFLRRLTRYFPDL
jgi:hypothetical protein